MREKQQIKLNNKYKYKTYSQKASKSILNDFLYKDI